MHTGHHFEIPARLSEDRAKNNTRQLKVTKQKRIQHGCVNIDQMQPTSHRVGNS